MRRRLAAVRGRSLPRVRGRSPAIAAAPAPRAVTNLYAPQVRAAPAPLLAQFAVAPDGALTRAARRPRSARRPQDIAITPDGRFAYVTRSAGAARLDRAVRARRRAGAWSPPGIGRRGRRPARHPRQPAGHARLSTPTRRRSRCTRARSAPTARSAPAAIVDARRAAAPRFLAMTPSGTSLYVSVAGAAGAARLPAVRRRPGDRRADAEGAGRSSRGRPAGAPATDGGRAHDRHARRPPPLRRERQSRRRASRASRRRDRRARRRRDRRRRRPTATATSVARGRAGRRLAVGADERRATPPGASTSSRSAPAARSPRSRRRRPPTRAGRHARRGRRAPTARTLYLGQDAQRRRVDDRARRHAAPAREPRRRPAAATNAGIALSPSQAPVASFTAAPAPPARPTTFDATRLVGSRRHDRPLRLGLRRRHGAAQRRAAPSHVYASPARATVTLTVTDADGTSTAQLWTGTRMLRNGGPSAQTTQRRARIPRRRHRRRHRRSRSRPGQGQVGDDRRDAGHGARQACPAAGATSTSAQLREIPLGSRIDARKGQRADHRRGRRHDARDAVVGLLRRASSTSAQTKGSQADPRGAGSSAARSPAAQPRRRARPRAGARGAPAARSPSAFAVRGRKKKRSKRKVRRLWGRGKGNFRTAGRRSSATVRGTWWLVEDRCDGTLTRVRQGRVDVRDFRLKKTIRLRAGKRFDVPRQGAVAAHTTTKATACAVALEYDEDRDPGYRPGPAIRWPGR